MKSYPNTIKHHAWPEERVNHALKLLAAGYSYQDIADKIGGVTRNAVAGKINRLKNRRSGFPSSNRRGENKIEERIRRVRNRAYKRDEATILTDAPIPLMLQCEELTMTTCRWPTGDPKSDDFGFCGHPAPADKPYCPCHTVISRADARQIKMIEAWRQRREQTMEAAE